MQQNLNVSAIVLRLTIKSIQQRMSNDMTLMGTNRHSQRHLYLSYNATTKTIGQNSTEQFHECGEESSIQGYKTGMIILSVDVKKNYPMSTIKTCGSSVFGSKIHGL